MVHLQITYECTPEHQAVSEHQRIATLELVRTAIRQVKLP